MKGFLTLKIRTTVLKFLKCWMKNPTIRKTQLSGLKTYKEEGNTVPGEFFTG